MKQGNNKNRNRGHNRNNNYRNNNRPNIPSKNQVFESNGPAGKIRGNLMQLIEKYLSAGKDALSQDDIVLAENCFQHADHYTRLYNLANAYEISRREEQMRQQQMRNETEDTANDETEGNNALTDDNVEEIAPVFVKEEDVNEIKQEEETETAVATAPQKEENKIADLPFLNTAINLPEDEKEETPKRKRVTLKPRKKNETQIANDTDITAETVSDATA